MNKGTKAFVVGAIFILVGILVLIALGDRGVQDLFRLRKERNSLLEANADLELKNEALYRVVDRLKNDPDLMERIARTELGMVAKDEMVILRQ